jgi:hypothetical protein
MTGHGGKRRNAGRKQVEISWGEMIEIGSRCKYLLHGQRRDRAIERSRRDFPASVTEVQRDIRAQRGKGAASVRKARSEVTRKIMIKLAKEDDERARKRVEKEITPLLDKLGRVQTLQRYMPKRLTREQVRQQVAKEWKAKGRPEITSRRIKDIWAEFDDVERTVRAHIESQS